MPEQVHDCVETVLEQNPDYSESRAWAICRAEVDAEAAEVVTRAELDVDAEALDDLAEESGDWATVPGGWVNQEEGLAVFGGLESEAESFGVDVFRIVQSEDGGMDLDGDLMGVGVDFPNAGVYVDWRIDAWPDDEQLDEPHVSDYGSIEDLEQATGGEVEPIETVDATDSEPDQQAVAFEGLSQEAIADVERRYNATVVDGEAGATPTDHENADDE